MFGFWWLGVVWLAVSGVTFDRWLNMRGSAFWPAAFLVPIVIGATATWWSGSAVTGRRAVRLATVIAAVTVYAYGVLAVAVQGAKGHDPSDGWTTAQIVADNLGNQAVFYLLALPMATATIGWAAAAATARILRRRPATQRPATESRTRFIVLLTAAILLSTALIALTLLRS